MTFSQGLCPCFAPPMTSTNAGFQPACQQPRVSHICSPMAETDVHILTRQDSQEIRPISFPAAQVPVMSIPMMNRTAIPLARDGLPILGAPIGTSVYQHRSARPLLLSSVTRTLTSSARLTTGISARSWLCIAATLALCICFAPYPLTWSGPSCPAGPTF